MRDGGDINGPISEGLGGLARADEFFNPIFDVFEVWEENCPPEDGLLWKSEDWVRGRGICGLPSWEDEQNEILKIYIPWR
jgi:hypothetical protein